MDIEALRKINTLTKELQKHGMSASSEDALTQAQHILQPLHEQNNASLTTTTEPAHNDVLLERKYKLLLEMNNKRFEESFQILNTAVSELTQEIGRLKTQLNNLRTTQPESPPVVQAPVEEHPAETAKKELHPRQGSFVPGDISIEKMFYFGHK